MKNFFQMMWKRGWRILLIVLLIWLVYFLITFSFPHAFDFLRGKNSFPGQTVEQKQSIPLRFRIYNLFFRGSMDSPLKKVSQNASTGEDVLGIEKPVRNYEPYVWGGASSTVRNKNRLIAEDYYISPNDRQKAVAQNFRLDGLLVKEKGINILSPGTIITGAISSRYLSSYYFNIDIYDSNGDYLYSIPATGYFDLKDENLLIFSATNNPAYNMYGYKGDGFMVIWTDNEIEVDSVLLVKIKID